MCQKTIALAGILLSSLVLAGCASAPSAASGPEWKPIGNRKARVVLWGVTHNHAKGKFDALKRLPDYYEIVGVVDNSASKVMRMAEPKMKNYEDLIIFADIFVRNKKYVEAKELLERLHAKTVTRRLLTQLIFVSSKTKNFVDAEKYYEEYVKIAPKDINRYVTRRGET